MKREQLLFLKLFFILTFFLCTGINAFSFYSNSLVSTEVSSCTCNDEICTCPVIDCQNEDQICQSLNSLSGKELCDTPLFKGTFLITSFYFIFWQPPKIS